MPIRKTVYLEVNKADTISGIVQVSFSYFMQIFEYKLYFTINFLVLTIQTVMQLIYANLYIHNACYPTGQYLDL